MFFNIFSKSLKIGLCVSMLVLIITFYTKLENFSSKNNIIITHEYTNAKPTSQTLKGKAVTCLKNSVGGAKGNISENATSQHCDFAIHAKFNKLLTSFGIKIVIIEPSYVYCMLTPFYKELLVKRHFSLRRFSGSDRIITYGIFQEDLHKLEEEEIIIKMSEDGFHKQNIRRPIASWMSKYNSKVKFSNFTSHILYVHRNCCFHLVVFYARGNYLWHGGIETEEKVKYFLNENVLFLNDEAYEKLTPTLLEENVTSFGEVYLPSKPHHFLFQMLSARFLECDESRAQNITGYKSSKKHANGMCVKEFNRKTVVAIRELKTIFQPLLMNFWIWSGTMLGWYRQCDIIPYTHDVDFAAWAFELEDLDAFIHSFLHSKKIAIVMRMGHLEEAMKFQLSCSNLRVDIFFMYSEQNGTWYAGHSKRGGYYFRYFYTNFTLCSADLLGEKVQVACETETMILAEYGPEWSKSATSWSWEHSPWNRGPNVYWSKEKLKSAYHTFNQ